MIELSLGKMVLLALIALIVLGPEKLPGAARTAGALLRRVRSGWDNVKAEVERELEIEEIRRSAREAVAGAEAAQQRVKDTLKDTHDPFAEAAAMVRLPSTSADAAPPTPDAAQPAQAGGRPAASSPARVASENPSPARAAETSGEPGGEGGQTPEGMQTELPLDEPPVGPQRDRARDGDTPHDHA